MMQFDKESTYNNGKYDGWKQDSKSCYNCPCYSSCRGRTWSQVLLPKLAVARELEQGFLREVRIFGINIDQKSLACQKKYADLIR